MIENAREALRKGIILWKSAFNQREPILSIHTAIRLFHLAKKEGLIEYTLEYGSVLCYEGFAWIDLARLNKDNSPTIYNKGIELCELSREKGLLINTYEFALSLSIEGTAFLFLAEINIDPINNLKKAIELFERARNDGYKQYSFEYALTLFDESKAALYLAENDIDPLFYYDKAIDCCKKAREKGLIKKTYKYAATLLRESYARSNLAKFGIDVNNNLNIAINCCEEARKNGLEQNTTNYALSLLNEGVARNLRAQFGIEPVNNIIEAIKLFKRARIEGFEIYTENYSKALLGEADSKITFVDLGENPNILLDEAINLCNEARNKGEGKYSCIFGKALSTEGMARLELARKFKNPISNLEKSIELFERARKEGLKDKSIDLAAALNNEGIARFTLATEGEDPQTNLYKSIELFEQSREIDRNKDGSGYIGSLINEANARVELINLIKDFSELKIPEKLLIEARNISEKTNITSLIIIVYNNLGLFYYLSKKYLEAYNYLKESIKYIEEIGNVSNSIYHKKNFIESLLDPYIALTTVCLDLGKYEEAFYYAELSKGRLFRDLLSSKKLDRIKGHDLLEEYMNLLNRLYELEFYIRTKGNLISVEQDKSNLQLIISDLVEKIKKNDPWLYSIIKAEPISITRLSELLKGKTLIEYIVRNDKTTVFIINDKMTIEEIDIGEKDIAEKLYELDLINQKYEEDIIYGASLNNAEKKEKADDILSCFYNELICPIKKHFNKEIIIIPHRFLHFIPFLALKGERYLLEDYKIYFAHSASSLEYSYIPTSSGALIVGDPNDNLKYSREEAITIAKLLKSIPILGKEATKDRIKKEIKDKEIIHFACHGFFNPKVPFYSGIKLHNDEYLSALEFLALEMNATITVLSACETAKGSISRGDEVEGLIRAIQHAGSRYVIASLWRVPDKSTKELFELFYSEEGDVVERLRKSQLRLLKKYGYYHWAPFQVYGI